MVVVGADVHKRTHTFVAVDDVGRKLAEKTVPATTVGHQNAIRWARSAYGTGLTWGIEDCRQMSARLERDLLTADQHVVRVPAKLMAHARASARTRGKSDPIDALAVARAVLREPDLPVAFHDEQSRELKLLIDRREDLVKIRTAMINRLRWRIHELEPGREPKPQSMDQANHRAALRDWLTGQTGTVAELALDELTDIDRLTEQINKLAKRVGKATAAAAPTLLEIPGCGELTAAKIVGETAGIGRFRSEAAYARHTGVAPIPVWSGSTNGRVRMTRTGNRQLNCALHRIAITQIRLPDSRGQIYYRKRLAAGDTKREALRCLKRRLARTIFNTLKTDHATNGGQLPTAA